MQNARHKMMDGRVQLYMRPDSPYWWCACSIKGDQKRKSTEQESLAHAKDVARDWYLTLLGKLVSENLMAVAAPGYSGGRTPLDDVGKYLSGAFSDLGRGQPKPTGKPFADAAKEFIEQFKALAGKDRNQQYIENHQSRIDNYLVPFFGKYTMPEITDGMIVDYRMKRMTDWEAITAAVKAGTLKLRPGQKMPKGPPARSTLHQEIVCLRQILKFAKRRNWMSAVLDLSEPVRRSTKISHRAWFSEKEYVTLYKATGNLAKNPPDEHKQSQYEDLHDMVLIMAHTGLRPDEALRLEYRDVQAVIDPDTGDRILNIDVRGKRGTGICKSMPNAVFPFHRLKKRNGGKPTDRLFHPESPRLFDSVLRKIDLKYDREGQPRTLYSLRHSYICFRLLAKNDKYQIAKNCRTSSDMIDKYYGSHIATATDASMINGKKPRAVRKEAQGDATSSRKAVPKKGRKPQARQRKAAKLN